MGVLVFCKRRTEEGGKSFGIIDRTGRSGWTVACSRSPHRHSTRMEDAERVIRCARLAGPGSIDDGGEKGGGAVRRPLSSKK